MLFLSSILCALELKALALDFTSSVVPDLSRAGSQGQRGRLVARDRSRRPGAARDRSRRRGVARDHSRGCGALSRRDLDSSRGG